MQVPAAEGKESSPAALLATPLTAAHLRGSAAGPVRRSHGDVDAGRGLRVGGVSPLGCRQPGDHQAAGEAALPEQQAERGRGRGHLDTARARDAAALE